MVFQREVKISDLTAYEKLDGSLLTVFSYKGAWIYRTKSMIQPKGFMMGWDVTWKEFIEDALGVSYSNMGHIPENLSFIFEITGRENRIVTHYADRSVTLLAVRNNSTGAYLDKTQFTTADWKLPREYKFPSLVECKSKANGLPNMEEGFVLYDKTGTPVCKVKSEMYVICHHLRGEGLNHKRLLELTVINEYAEYLNVFPEDTKYFTSYISHWTNIQSEIDEVYEEFKDIESQKEFASNVAHFPYSPVLFQARNSGEEPIKVLHSQKTSFKVKLLGVFKKEEKV